MRGDLAEGEEERIMRRRAQAPGDDAGGERHGDEDGNGDEQ